MPPSPTSDKVLSRSLPNPLMRSAVIADLLVPCTQIRPPLSNLPGKLASLGMGLPI